MRSWGVTCHDVGWDGGAGGGDSRWRRVGEELDAFCERGWCGARRGSSVLTWSGPNTAAPSVSGNSLAGSVLSTTNGSWTASCGGATVTGYQWKDNGGAIGGATGGSYTTNSGQVGHSITSSVTACNADTSDCKTVDSSNSITVTPPPPPPNNPPTTSHYNPASGTVGLTNPGMSVTYTDPEGDPGTVTFRLYNLVGALQVSFTSGTVGQSQDASWFPSMVCGSFYWTAQATDNGGHVGSASAPVYYRADCIPTTSGATPADAATFPTASVALAATAGDPDGDPIFYRFQVATDAAFSNVVSDSQLLPGTSTFTPWPGSLIDGGDYFWRVYVGDFATGSLVSNVLPTRTFHVRLTKLGARSYWPLWSRGPLAVNEGNGNLIVSAPGPSFPAAALSLGLSLTNNSLNAADAGLGRGWTIAASGQNVTPPAQLVDHSLAGASPQFDAVERVNGGTDRIPPRAWPRSSPSSMVLGRSSRSATTRGTTAALRRGHRRGDVGAGHQRCCPARCRRRCWPSPWALGARPA